MLDDDHIDQQVLLLNVPIPYVSTQICMTINNACYFSYSYMKIGHYTDFTFHLAFCAVQAEKITSILESTSNLRTLYSQSHSLSQ